MKEKPGSFRFWITCAIAVVVNSILLPLHGSEIFTDANWISFGGVPGADGPVNTSIVDEQVIFTLEGTSIRSAT